MCRLMDGEKVVSNSSVIESLKYCGRSRTRRLEKALTFGICMSSLRQYVAKLSELLRPTEAAICAVVCSFLLNIIVRIILNMAARTPLYLWGIIKSY